jgi:hypothetical protein
MTEHIQRLTETELQSACGGSWEDFHSGFTYALTVGCFLSANPFVCGASVVSVGFGLYAF